MKYTRLTILMGATLALASCDNGPSAVPRNTARDAGGAGVPASAQAGSAAGTGAGAESPDHRRDPVRLVDGKPVWAPSRRYSAEEAARRAFDRNGRDFGAGTLDAYVSKARAFVEHPPKGVQTLTRRNGDTLFYDPKANIFAVASPEGAPRAMFKPDDGPDYWDEQKAREGGASGRRRDSGQ